jgi:hypothetical protein
MTEPDAPETLTGQDLLVREGDIAGDYLERLLDIADVDGDIDMDVEGERARCWRRSRSSPGSPWCGRPGCAAG